jgi:hypothetical protein
MRWRGILATGTAITNSVLAEHVVRQRDANADERADRMRQRRAGVSSSQLSVLVSATVAEQII